MIHFFYALLVPSLPLAWPVPPLDFLLLLAACGNWRRQLPLMVWIDVLLGQPGVWWRWPLWCLWTWLLLGQTDWLEQPAVKVSGAAALGFFWYWALGPAFSPLGGVAVAIECGLLIWLWLPAPQRQLKSWGWHRA